MLTPNTPVDQIDTGVPGLRVTAIRQATSYDGGVAVDFDPAPGGGCGFVYRKRDGCLMAAGAGQNPPAKLTLRQPPVVDWTKPIRTRHGVAAKVIADLPDHNLKVIDVEGDVCLVRLNGTNTEQADDDEPWFENPPVVTTRTYRVVPNGDVLWIASPVGPRPNEAEIQITLIDGIVSGTCLVSPNREPHPC